MNLTNLVIKGIDRIIAHEIHPKTDSKDAYAITREKFLSFTNSEKEMLIDRIIKAVSNSSKTFQLEFENEEEGSICSFLKTAKNLANEQFIDYSKLLANNLADSHFRTNIPGGFCLTGIGKTSDDRFFFFVIKAELQEVFNIQDDRLQLIKDVFLSPAKDFYKIGFFIEKSNDEFVPFMYDDQFSMQKKDLTEYFYGKFLGLTTSKNDKLKSKNFFNTTKNFIEKNIDNVKDRIGLLKTLTVLYREETTGIIAPKDFSDSYFEEDLKNKYDKIINKDFPHSFTKDTSLIESKLELKRISIPLTYAIDLVGDSLSLENIEIIENPTIADLEPEINSGLTKKVVLLKQIKNNDLE